MNLLNQLFSEGNLVILIMFFLMFAFGLGSGLLLTSTKTKEWRRGLIHVSLVATLASWGCYELVSKLTEADQPLVATKAPMSSEDRYNAILADNGPSNYGDDWYKIQK